jgi:hypothetical protein
MWWAWEWQLNHHSSIAQSLKCFEGLIGRDAPS